VNALHGEPILYTLRDPQARIVLRAAILEAIDVFTAAGIPLATDGPPVTALPKLLGLPSCIFRCVQPLVKTLKPDAKTSMLIDIQNNRLTEVDFLNGEVVRVAQEHGLPEPKVNLAIILLIKAAEEKGTGSPELGGRALMAECGLE